MASPLNPKLLPPPTPPCLLLCSSQLLPPQLAHGCSPAPVCCGTGSIPSIQRSITPPLSLTNLGTTAPPRSPSNPISSYSLIPLLNPCKRVQKSSASERSHALYRLQRET
uniref:Uncharacterized protein n=1 Tax=Arundo donax TaxID=35708 RepID=A0A0A9ATI8_ARUDO